MIKRRSEKQSHTLELLDYTFFTDRDLGHKFPEALKVAGLNVEIHDDHFSDDTEDVEWFKEIGEKGWIVISHNHRQRTVPYEVDTWMNSKVRGFYVIGRKPFQELADNFIAAKHKVVKRLNKHNHPFMAKIYMPGNSKSLKSGNIKMWYTYDEWRQDQLK